MNIAPLDENAVEELSQFLLRVFHTPSTDQHFLSPEVIRWKHLQPRHKWTNPTSFIARDAGRIVAHIGVTPTEIVCPHRQWQPVPAYYPIEWAADPGVPMAGMLALLHTFGLPGVHYSFGSTALGLPILLRCGFRAVMQSGTYYQVYNWYKPAVWRFMHGRPRLHLAAAMLALDLPRAIVSPLRAFGAADIALRRLKQFESDPAEHEDVKRFDLAFTSRAPGLLNYLLAYPGGHMTGWQIERNGVRVGQALLNIIERDGLRRGHIVDCLLYSQEANVWTGAVRALARELKRQGADLTRCYAAAPWFAEALRRNGFFRRGRQSLYFRDPLKRLPEGLQYFMTDIEGDAAY